MAGIGICANTKCKHKDKCLRFLTKTGSSYEFKNICNKNNHYKWLWKTETAIVNK